MIDFRSDTVTQPTPDMLQFMMQAPVGDDVYHEDPTVNALQEKVAQLFNMEAALFCPSGTMSNQIAIKCHTQPGNEVICDVESHIYQYEAGGIAFHSGCSVKLPKGDRGRLTVSLIEACLNDETDIHKPISRLVSLENTVNRGGGCCYNFSELVAIKQFCVEKQLALHLDGARLFNALVAQNQKPEDYGNLFDSISICLSKGLGAPVGSVLIGKKTFIDKALRIRKLFGGGMRQAGIVAAAGIYALDHHVQRLQEDHAHAKILANALSEKKFVKQILPVETNIILFEVNEPYSPASIQKIFEEKGIKTGIMGSNKIRMVTHLNITDSMVDYTIKVIQQL